MTDDPIRERALGSRRRPSGRGVRRAIHWLPALAAGAAFLLAAPLPAAEKTDLLVLDNGDRLTGEIKVLERGELSFKTDALGTLAVEWLRVGSLASVNSFDVELTDGSRYFGSLESGEQGELVVAAQQGKARLLLAEVVKIRRIRRSLWARVDGSLALGLNYTSASSTAQGSLSADATTRNLNVERVLSASFIVTDQADSGRTSRSELSWAQRRLLRRRRLLLCAGQLQQNDELGIHLRGLVMAGYGRRFRQTNRTRFGGVGRLALNVENAVGSAAGGGSLEGLVGCEYEFFRKVGLDRDVSVQLLCFPGLEDGSRHRFDFRAALQNELVKDLGLRLELRDSFDSRPPAELARRNDLSTVVSIVWSY